MSYQPAQSPWDVANNPPEQTQEYFGEASLNAWFCMLAEGMGKIPYDERTLDPKTGKPVRRYTAIDLELVPLAESGLAFEVKRSMLAEFGEWKDTTWPSLRDLGVLDAATINGKFAKIAMVGTGRKYTSRNGEEREATAIKFLAVYADRQQCVDAWRAETGAPATPSPAPAQSANGNGNGTVEKITALKFAKVYVQNAARATGKDPEKMREVLMKQLADQPLISKHFTVDSQEIVDLILAEVA